QIGISANCLNLDTKSDQLLSCTKKFFIDIVNDTQINSSTYATRTLSTGITRG
ncbi:unnamed protein product, partial [Rotaria sp. Silwood1]